MSDSNQAPQYLVQKPLKKNKLPLIIAGTLAFFLIGGAIALLFLGIQNSDEATEESPVAGDYAPIEFAGPKGMGSGGIVFGEGLNPLDSPAIAAGATPKPHVSDRESGEVDILVYVDYRCPHCMMFEQVNSGVLEEAIVAGNAKVEIRPLTFMDRYSAGTAYSSRAANLIACTVENKPEFTWMMHNLLLNPNVQPEGEGPGHDNEMLLEMTKNITGSMDATFADCITEERYVPFMGAINDWTFMHPVPGAVDASLMVEGTPLVVVNGFEYSGDISDSNNLYEFLKEQGVAFE
ncbi:MAG TPA: thioredoxin domain-containing protein [Microbacteriaceae bacterium]|nr:thioredoxin domain-containing protein [Microbacteriaceae bacterium]